MIFVDSGVWIDHFNNVLNAQTERLDQLFMQSSTIVTGDLVLVEVLQGFETEREFNAARRALAPIPALVVGGSDVALAAAINYRRLRRLGVTVRKTIDTLIATRCIASDLQLLHRDRDFDPFIEHLGLRSAMA